MLGWIDRRCRQASGHKYDMLGGKSVILVGDPAQLPPTGDKCLYHSRPTSAAGEEGNFVYSLFDDVVELDQNHRGNGCTPEQPQFKLLLTMLRNGESTIEDWQLLLSRQPSSVTNIDDYKDAVRLYFSNDQVNSYNEQKICELDQPVEHIFARHSDPYAKTISPDDMSGLEPQIQLAKGAKVMLTMNLCTILGLCNGATGVVIDIVFETNTQPPDLPIAVIVKFKDYTGPSFCSDNNACVPICPITVRTEVSGKQYERQQLPLCLAWVITIHKSQGLTLELAWIDLGKSERVDGLPYVAISRVRNLSNCVIEPMSFERLQSIKKSTNFLYRIEEEQRLRNLAQLTLHKYKNIL